MVHGRVQGVGFRWWTRRVADRLGVMGTVRNRPDGTVEVMARGSDEALERFADELRSGPPMARVADVVECAAKLPEDCDAFEIVS